MRQQVKHRLTVPAERVGEGMGPVQIDAERQHIDEEPDKTSALIVEAARERNTEDNVALPGQLREHERESRSEHGEDGGALRSGQCPDRGGGLGTDAADNGRTGEVARLGPDPIGGQLQPLSSGQQPPPVVGLAGPFGGAIGEPGLLPGGIGADR